MQNTLPADRSHSSFRSTRGSAEHFVDMGLILAGSGSVLKGALNQAYKGYAATRAAFSAKQAQKSLGVFSRELRAIEKPAIKIQETKNFYQIGNYKYTKTVSKHFEEKILKGDDKGMLSRPYMRSQQLINEIMFAKRPISDPGGLSGGLRWDVPGAFRKSEGTWELVLDPKNNTIHHFVFKGDK